MWWFICTVNNNFQKSFQSVTGQVKYRHLRGWIWANYVAYIELIYHWIYAWSIDLSALDKKNRDVYSGHIKSAITGEIFKTGRGKLMTGQNIYPWIRMNRLLTNVEKKFPFLSRKKFRKNIRNVLTSLQFIKKFVALVFKIIN